jgi:hypothetical protein
MNEPQLMNGRKCGRCTLCCKLLRIDVFSKPRGIWCKHCDLGRGCRIYQSRPDECRTFLCNYLAIASGKQLYLDEHWYPADCKMVLYLEGGNCLAIHVDPSRPAAWQCEPYRSQINSWAVDAAADGQQVIVYVGKRAIAILPDGDEDLGIMEEGDRIITSKKNTPAGPRFKVLKVKADDPRIPSQGPDRSDR